MVQLIKTDWSCQRKIAYFMPLFFLFYVTMASSQSVSAFSFGATVAMIAFVMVSYANMNTDEGSLAERRLLVSLPVARKTIVIGKYAMSAVWCLTAWVPSVLLFILASLMLGDTVDLLFLLKTLLVALCLIYLLTSAYYPLLFRFSYKKAQWGVQLIWVAFVFFLVFAFNQFMYVGHAATDLLEHVASTVLLLVGTCALTLLSLFVSTRFFAKKDL